MQYKFLLVLFLSGIWSPAALAGACELINIKPVAKFKYQNTSHLVLVSQAIQSAVNNPAVRDEWNRKVAVVNRQRTRWVSESSMQQRFQDLKKVSQSMDMNLFFKSSMMQFEQSLDPKMNNWESSKIEKWVDGLPFEERGRFVAGVLAKPFEQNLTPKLRKYHDFFVYFLATEKVHPAFNIYGFLATLAKPTLDQFVISYANHPLASWSTLPPRAEVGQFVQMMGHNVEAAVDFLVHLQRYQNRLLAPTPDTSRGPRISVYENLNVFVTPHQVDLAPVANSKNLERWLRDNHDRVALGDMRLAKMLMGDNNHIAYISKEGVVSFYPNTSRREWPLTVIKEFQKILLRSAYGLMALDLAKQRTRQEIYTRPELAMFPTENEILFDLTVLERWALLRPLWERTQLNLEESLRLSWAATERPLTLTSVMENYRELFPNADSLQETHFLPQGQRSARQLREIIKLLPESEEFTRFHFDVTVGSPN